MTTTTVPAVAERVPDEEIAYVGDECLAVHPDFGQVIQDWTNPLDYDPSAVWAEPRDAALRLLGELLKRGWRPPGEPALPAEAFTNPARLVDLLAASAEHHGWTVDRSEHTRSTLLHVARALVQILIPADPDVTEGGA